MKKTKKLPSKTRKKYSSGTTGAGYGTNADGGAMPGDADYGGGSSEASGGGGGGGGKESKKVDGAALGAGLAALAPLASSVISNKRAANVASTALSTAAAGAAIGGPWGAAAGAVVGTAIGLVKNSQEKKRIAAEKRKKRREAQDALLKLQVESTDVFSTKESIYNNARVDGDSIVGLPDSGRIQLAKGGKVRGPGTTKSDSIKTSLPKGAVVVPAENSKLAEGLAAKYLNKGQSTMKGGGNVPVALSDKEYVFTPQEKKIIEKKYAAEGGNVPQLWNMLIPNPAPGNELSDGTKNVKPTWEEFLKQAKADFKKMPKHEYENKYGVSDSEPVHLRTSYAAKTGNKAPKFGDDSSLWKKVPDSELEKKRKKKEDPTKTPLQKNADAKGLKVPVITEQDKKNFNLNQSLAKVAADDKAKKEKFEADKAAYNKKFEDEKELKLRAEKMIEDSKKEASKEKKPTEKKVEKKVEKKKFAYETGTYSSVITERQTNVPKGTKSQLQINNDRKAEERKKATTEIPQLESELKELLKKKEAESKFGLPRVSMDKWRTIKEEIDQIKKLLSEPKDLAIRGLEGKNWRDKAMSQLGKKDFDPTNASSTVKKETGQFTPPANRPEIKTEAEYDVLLKKLYPGMGKAKAMERDSKVKTIPSITLPDQSTKTPPKGKSTRNTTPVTPAQPRTDQVMVPAPPLGGTATAPAEVKKGPEPEKTGTELNKEAIAKADKEKEGNKIGPTEILALGQIMTGLISANKERPKDQVNPLFINRVASSIGRAAKAEEEAQYGFSYKERQSINQNLEQDRLQAMRDTIQVSSGAGGISHALRGLSQDKNRAQLNIATADASLKLQKKGRADAVSAQADQMTGALDGRGRQIFGDDLDAYWKEAGASASLIDAGLSNYFNSMEQKKIDKMKEDRDNMNITVNVPK